MSAPTASAGASGSRYDEEVGRKFGKWLDVVLMQRLL